MIIRDASEITAAVQSEIVRAPNLRFREIMTAVVHHLHPFVRETKLTEAEFQQACGCIHESLGAPLETIRVIAIQVPAQQWAVGDQTRDEIDAARSTRT